MKILPAFVVALLALAPTMSSLAQTVEKQACNVTVDITDTDPKGTNVRAAPGGAVIASLSNPNVDGWIAVHITGLSGDWYEIDRANLINADLGPDGKVVFHGRGYLHKSVVGSAGCIMMARFTGIMTSRVARLIFMPPANKRWTCWDAGVISLKCASRKAPAGRDRPAPIWTRPVPDRARASA
jgi:hypothetical protein